MPASFLEALDFLDWLGAGFAGWRYLASASFRRATHTRWLQESRARVFWDVICGVAGVAFSVLVVYVVISLFAGWDWFQKLIATEQARVGAVGAVRSAIIFCSVCFPRLRPGYDGSGG